MSFAQAPAAHFTYNYDNLGNITYKSDVGSYAYDPLNQPHAVRTAGGASYGYDANGNQTSRPQDGGVAILAYTPFDKLRSVTGPLGTTAFEYDGDRQRVRKTTPSSITTYVGGLFERREIPLGVEYKMHVVGPEGVVAVVTSSWAATRDAGMAGITRGSSPSIWMTTADHAMTPSFGGSAGAAAFRAEQQAFIQSGRYLDALKMDVDAIRSIHGARYEGAIDQMGQYVWQIGQ